MQDTVALNGTARHIVDRWTSGAVLGQLRRVLAAAARGSATTREPATPSGVLGANSGERPLSCNIAQTGGGGQDAFPCSGHVSGVTATQAAMPLRLLMGNRARSLP